MEWTTAELCIPRKISSTKAIFCGDVGFDIESFNPRATLQEKKIQIHSIVDRLVPFLMNVNLNAEYVNWGELFGSGGNCQDFVGKCLQVIDAKIDFEKDVQSILKRMAKNGDGDFTLMVTHPKIRDVLPSIKKKMIEYREQRKSRMKENYRLDDENLNRMFGANHHITFGSHVQLDVFCHELVAHLSSNSSREEVLKEFSSEFELLKSYDRAFWLRLYKATPIFEKWRQSSISDAITNCNDPAQKELLKQERNVILEKSRWEPLEKVAQECFFDNPMSTASLPMVSFNSK